MMMTSEIETQRILGKKASAMTRYFPGGQCTYKEGQVMDLCYDLGRGGPPKRFARIKVMNITPMTVEERMADNAMANKLRESEGFSHQISWSKHLAERYGGMLGDSVVVHRIGFTVEEIYSDKPKKTEEEIRKERYREALRNI